MNQNPEFTMTKEEATALYRELEHSFITYDSLVVPLIIRLAIFVKQHELDKRSSPPTQGV